MAPDRVPESDEHQCYMSRQVAVKKQHKAHRQHSLLYMMVVVELISLINDRSDDDLDDDEADNNGEHDDDWFACLCKHWAKSGSLAAMQHE